MKNLTTLITLTTLTLASFYTVAGVHVEHGTKRIVKNNFVDKSTAYEESFDFINQLEDMSQAELRNKLSIIGQGFSRDIKLENTYVTVEEYPEELYEIKYRAIVNVNYNYRVNDSRNK